MARDRNQNDAIERGNNVYKLLSTSILNAKGTRNALLNQNIQRIDVMHADIPLLSNDIPNFQSYVESLITEYDKYLGFSSGLNFTQVKDALKANLAVFAETIVLKRYYDTKNTELAGGARTGDICQTMAIIGVGAADTIDFENRFGSDIRNLSNAVWVSDIISPFSEVLLPNALLALYGYYLQNVFDISSRDTNEALSLLVLWPSETLFDLGDMDQDGTGETISKTSFASKVYTMRQKNTPRMRDFLVRFLKWASPASWDMTRDIYGNSMNIVRDEKLILTLNNISPETVDSTGPVIMDEDDNIVPNGWGRVYTDFEMIYDNSDAHELIADRYYFAISGVAFEGYLAQYNDDNNAMMLDFTSFPLLALICAAETQQAHFWSLFTSINVKNGSLIDDRDYVKQFCWGNDIQLLIGSWDEGDSVPAVIPSIFYPIIGDYGEANDVKDQLAIFNYPVTIKERWACGLGVDSSDDPYKIDTSLIKAFISYDLPTNIAYVGGDWSITKPHDNTIDHSSDNTGFTTFIFDNEEVNVALEAVVFFMVTGFVTYSSAINYISAGFANKQQSTDN